MHLTDKEMDKYTTAAEHYMDELEKDVRSTVFFALEEVALWEEARAPTKAKLIMAWAVRVREGQYDDDILLPLGEFDR